MGRSNLITKCFSIILLVLLVGIGISPLIDFIQKEHKVIDNEFSSRACSVSGALGSRGWWNPDWSYSEKITINHLKVADDLTNFPVLFSVVSDDLKNAQPDGDDFVFISQDNTTKYNHEIELYDHLTGELIAWINLPSISADEDTIFYIYYGNPSCGNQENVAGTWDSNYVGVFHMNQASGSMIDSAGTQDATNYENDTQYQQNGKVGYCVELGGYIDGGYFLVEGNNDAYKFHNDDVTLEAWVKLDQNKFSDDTIIFLGRSTTTWPPWPQMTLRKLKNTEENGKFMMQCGETNESKTRALSNDNGDGVIGRWIHAVGVVDYSGDELSLFMDGIKQTFTDTVVDYDLSALPDYQFKVAIGYDGMGEDPNYNYLDGKIDEVRISNVARSPAWISTSYNYMFDPESFMVFGEGYTITTTCVGDGTISKNPDQTTYFPDTIVELTANAGIGWTFSHWSGDVPPGQENDNPITISMDDNKDIAAYFTEIYYNLDVTIDGSGSVVLDPSGGSYTYGTIVELNATGDPGWTFDHWDGNLSGDTTPEYITMNEDKIVIINFIELVDSTPPEITNVSTTPSSTHQGGYVNITCDVTDNVAINEVWINITYPDDTSENLTMNGTSYYKNQTYSMIGTYYYFIWANDTNGNANISLIDDFVVSSVMEVSDPYPLNGSTGISRPPTNISVQITGANLDVYFCFYNMTPVTDTWIQFASWTGVFTGRYEFNDFNSMVSDWKWGNTTYQWTVNVTDGITWVNKSYTYSTTDSRYDVDNDGIVDVFDLNKAWSHRTGGVYFYDGIYDVDYDSIIDVFDLNYIWSNKT